MRFGLYSELQGPPGKPHVQTYGEILEVIEHADRLGYHNYSLVEHPWYEQFSICPNPLAVFAAAAQRTRQIRFRTALHPVPLHNPLRLAGEVAAADILTGGRLEVGLGRGHAWVYPPGQVPVAESAGRLAEGIEVLLRAWTEDRFSYEGQYYRFRDVAVVPKPLQRPYPPLYTGGGSEATLRHAAERGLGLMVAPFATPKDVAARLVVYRDACARHGTTPEVVLVRAVYLDHDAERAAAECREAVVRFLNWQASPRAGQPSKEELLAVGWTHYANDAYWEHLRTVTYEKAVAEGLAYVGTPEQVAEQIATAWGPLQADELMVIAHFGGLEAWQVLKTQELFAREVIPLLRQRGL